MRPPMTAPSQPPAAAPIAAPAAVPPTTPAARVWPGPAQHPFEITDAATRAPSTRVFIRRLRDRRLYDRTTPLPDAIGYRRTRVKGRVRAFVGGSAGRGGGGPRPAPRPNARA